MKTARTRIGKITLKTTGQTFRPAAAQSSTALTPVEPTRPAFDANSHRRGTLQYLPSIGPRGVAKHLPQLRRSARQLERNTAIVRHGVAKLASEIVGTGIKPLPKVSDPDLKRALVALWEQWVPVACTDETTDLYGLQWLSVLAMVRDGEAFVRFRPRRPEDGLPVPLQLQVLEADLVPLDTDEAAGLLDGIRYDAIGRREAYRVLRAHPGDFSLNGSSLDYTEVPAADVCHLFSPRRLGQTRGETWLVAILQLIEGIALLNDADLQKKQTAALLAGFLTSDRDATDATLFDEGGALGGDAPDDAGVSELALAPGTISALRPGQRLEWSTPPQDQTYEAHLKARIREVAVGLGLTYEQLSSDWVGISDRTLKVALLEVQRVIEGVQHHVVVHQLIRPIWRRFVAAAELAGAIVRPAGMTDAELLSADFAPQSKSWSHPVQDVNAKIAALKAGLTSRRRILAEQGEDVEAVFAEVAEDRDLAADLGLTFEPDAGGGGSAPADSTAGATSDGDNPEPAA